MRLKRIGCLVLVAILSLPLAAPVKSYAAGKFSDTSGHWAESYINTAVSKKIINGYPDGRFLPDKAVTRAEFATMVNKALGNTGTESLSFRDVYNGEWYYNDIAKAVAAAYTAGYDDNTFRPNNPITRQEAAVMISRIVPTYGKSGNLKTYSDYRSIADWAYDAMAKVNGKGYVGAYNDGKIHPADQLTRAQTAKIICDILDNETVVTSTPVIEDDGTKLSGKIYSNNVTIDEDLGEDSATIDNCVILGTLSVKGGGTDTITVNNSRVANVTINKDDDPVRLLAKGETSIVRLSASQASILQTSSLSGGLFGPGFSNVTVNGSAEVTLRGTFPKVNVTGSKADLTLESGTIDILTVDGRYSNITAERNTAINTATVNAESYFHGSGTISQMNVNANGITYETKPKRWTIKSSVDTPTQSDEASDITFSPKNGSTNVKRDAKITITFNSAMKMYDGSSISNSMIDDFVELRKGSASGSLVSYSASINSAKTVITITPDSNLSADTRYYIIIDKNSLRDNAGNGNTAQSIYFSTGDDYGSVKTTFSPENGATAVPVNTNITIAFSEAVVRYSNGATISSGDSYLTDCLVFKETNSSGKTVSYTASINSTKKTITITPKANLTLNQKYYVAVVGNKLKTKEGDEAIPSSSVTWTTGVNTPVVNTLALTPGDTTITASLASSVAGTAYLIVLPSGDDAPKAAQIVAGQNAKGIVVDSGYKASGSVSANTAKTFSFSGLTSSTQYKVYAVVRANGIDSAIKNATTTTTKPVSLLSKLEVIPVVSGADPKNQVSFNKDTKSYNITLNSAVSKLMIDASGDGNISINGGSAVSGSTRETVDLAAGNQTISITIEKSGTDSTTYYIVVNRDNDDGIASLSVNGSKLSETGEMNYQLPGAGEFSIKVDVTASDPFAVVKLGATEAIRSGSYTFTLPESTSDQTFNFSIISGSKEGKYTITFVRPKSSPTSSEGTSL